MASGHVNRTNRPNTWLHRPSLRREDSPCQPGAVHTWHICDISNGCIGVRYRGAKRKAMLNASSSGFDPHQTSWVRVVAQRREVVLLTLRYALHVCHHEEDHA